MEATVTTGPATSSGFFLSSGSRRRISLQKKHALFFPSKPFYRIPPSSATSVRASALAVETVDAVKTDYDSQIGRFCEMGNLDSAVNFLEKLGERGRRVGLRSYCSVLQLCAELKSLEAGVKVHRIVSSFGDEIDGFLGSKLVFMYVKCGDLASGRQVFDAIGKGNVFMWNLVMNEYARIGEYWENVVLFERMLDLGIELNSHSFSCILKCLAALGSVGGGKQIHGLMLKLGFEACVARNALIAFYLKCKRIGMACKVFDEMLERDVITWNSMISGYISNGLTEKAIQVFKEMCFTGVLMDLATLISVLPACADMQGHWQGKTLHGYAIKTGFMGEITLNNSLLNMYSKCEDLFSAVQLFSRMDEKNVVSWTTMISGYARDGQFNKALRLFFEMETEGVRPDLFAITSVLNACASNGSLDSGKQIHDYITRNGLGSNFYVANSLMDMYAKCGSMADAKSIFDEMATKDIVSWNTIIGGYSKNSLPNEALVLFASMQSVTKPNSMTLASVLPACASLSALERGREIHGHLLRNGFFEDNYVANALIDMYAKCGALALARTIFDMMSKKDLISWTIIIAGYSMHGRGGNAISAFNEMREIGIEPDEISFTAILHSCIHSGLVDEGWRFFNIMRYGCKIVPKLDHYACMVDLLARAGHLNDAYKFIESIPIEPDSSVWGSLLSGCRAHRDVILAEKVAERIFELEPENTGHYVLLSNIYAEAEKWEAVNKLRNRIGRQKQRKNPCCSWIEIKSKVHVFVSGDKSHQQSQRIWSFLEGVNTKMKEEGYVSEKQYALIDVGDNNKKKDPLCGHSERMAIAFGILSFQSKKPVRVTKNLRTCRDCHEVAKFMSKTIGREIVLRDSNRFHHFVNGRCSCRG